MCTGDCDQGRSECSKACKRRKTVESVFVEIGCGIVFLLIFAVLVNASIVMFGSAQ